MTGVLNFLRAMLCLEVVCVLEEEGDVVSCLNCEGSVQVGIQGLLS